MLSMSYFMALAIAEIFMEPPLLTKLSFQFRLLIHFDIKLTKMVLDYRVCSFVVVDIDFKVNNTSNL